MNYQQAIRDESIAKIWATGKTLQETGSKFDMTRERVRQIIQNPGLKKYHARRRQANLEFAETYNPTPVCQRCRESLKPVQFRRKAATAKKLCSNCGIRLRTVRRVQAYLRKLGATCRQRGRWDSPQALNQAVYLIRKHNLKPEDFR